MPKLIELLKKRSNNYSEIEKEFYNTTGEKLLSKDTLTKKYITRGIDKLSYSVVIPSYGFTEYLDGLLISLDTQIYKKNFEVIIVTNKSKDDRNYVLYKPKRYKLKLINLKRNYGRAFARNIGLAYSKGNIISFIDSDMLLPNNFIIEHLYRMSISDDLILVSLYENLSTTKYNSTLKKLIKKRFNFNGGYHKDFRYKQRFGFKDIKEGYNITKRSINKDYYLLRDTKNFKEFGFGIKYGIWRLPEMLLTIAMTLSRNRAISTGGFDTRFRGWGYEDSHFGAKLIATGAYIIPIYNCVTYRVRHQPREGSITRKYTQAKINKLRYNKFLNQEFNTQKLSKSFMEKYSIKRLHDKGIDILEQN